MEIEKTSGHVLKNGSLQRQWYLCESLEKIIQTSIKLLHDEHRELAVWNEEETQEESDVRMTQAGHQPTLLDIFSSDLLNTNVSSIHQSLMYLLSSACQSIDYNLRLCSHTLITSKTI